MPHPSLFTTLDPAVQTLFDDLTALMQMGFPSVTAFGSFDGAGVNLGITLTDPSGVRENYTVYTPGTRVQIQPGGVSLGSGETQQFTASATDSTGQPVAGATFLWSLVPASLGTIDASGLYTAPAEASAATDTVKAMLADGTAWATMPVSLHA